MVEIISMGVPALLAVGIYEKLDQKELSVKSFLLHYLSFLVVFLLLNEVILTYLFHNGENALIQGSFTNQFTIKYLIISIVEIFILPYLYVAFKKNIQIEIEVGKRYEKKRNH